MSFIFVALGMALMLGAVTGRTRLFRPRALARLMRRLRGQSGRAFLIKQLPPRTIGAEIGVHKGDFSATILRRTDPARLHLIDPWQHETSDTYKDAWYGGKAQGGQTEMDDRYRTVCARFDSAIRSGQVEIHRGYSSDVLREFPDAYFDWVYIDGNHLYAFVLQDLALSFQKVKPGGLILGDDYRSGGWWQGGVKQAVTEFLHTHPVTLVEIRNRQFILRKR